MSKIATYPSADTPLQLSDRLIGTEAIRPVPSPTPLATKNFSLGELLQLFSSNFPAASLQAVLDTGNTATQNITLIGTIDTTVIKPDNIEDITGSQGTVFQYLSKGASSINWVDLPVDNLQAVLNSGNTATQSITLVGNITSTKIIPGNIQDDTSGIGTTGQLLSKTASGIRWINTPILMTPGLADVLSVGNTATNSITLIGNVTATSFIKSGGTNLQYLMADGSVTTGGGSQNLQQVTDAGNTTTNEIKVVASGLFETVIGPNYAYTSNIGTTEFAGFSYDGYTSRLLIGSNSFETAIRLKIISSAPFEFVLPNDKIGGVYTLATTDDIPTIGTWGELDYPIWTAGTPFVKMTAVGTFALDTNTYLTTAVTSVGMTVPSAFSVTPSSITTSGTFAITGAGAASQYVRGDGTLANFPTSTGGGASVSYYLNGSVSQGTIGGVAYKEMNGTPIIGAGTDFTINADGYIAQFITDVGDPNKLLIPAGNWNFETYFSASSGGGSPRFYIELYKYNGATFTLITSSSATPENITGGTSIDLYFTAIAVPATTLLATDRLAVRFYVIHSGRTITMHTEDSHLSQIITTFSTGLTTLNGLTSQAQYFAVGTTGTDFNISSATDTHTFNLPTASATNRGALSTTDWSTFNNKANANTELNIRRTGYTVYNEFLASITNGSYSQATVLAGTITSATGNVDANHFGVVTFNSSVTANSGFYSALNPSATVGISCTLVTDLQTDLVFKTPVTISPTTTIRFGIGLGSITSVDFTNGFYFEIVGNSLVGKTAASSVRSSSSAYTIATNTWYHLRVIATSTTLITYYVYDMDGTLLFSTTLNTNLPTTTVVMNNIVVATNSGIVSTILGYFDLISITFPSMVRGALN